MALSAITLVIFLTAGLAACSQPVDLSDEQRDASLSWLGVVDAGSYSESWESSSTVFKAAVSESDWVQQVRRARGPLGRVSARKQKQALSETNPSGAPDGEYIVITYETSFDHKAEAIEIVSLYQDTDASWGVVGYFIK